ncbi:hypothetical protein SFC65_20355 [Priestia filamentosa]|uniref:hypothetical protein n=1 Tax=Priestia filamentosa TaxID=1402861 RepID=UPI0039823334
MENIVKIRQGKLIFNKLGDQLDNLINLETEKEEIIKIIYGEYKVIVHYQIEGVYGVGVYEGDCPIVYKETGDREGLVFTLQTCIDILTSFQGRKHKRKLHNNV